MTNNFLRRTSKDKCCFPYSPKQPISLKKVLWSWFSSVSTVARLSWENQKNKVRLICSSYLQKNGVLALMTGKKETLIFVNLMTALLFIFHRSHSMRNHWTLFIKRSKTTWTQLWPKSRLKPKKDKNSGNTQLQQLKKHVKLLLCNQSIQWSTTTCLMTVNKIRLKKKAW